MALIALVSATPRVSFTDLQKIALACSYQLAGDVGPDYEKHPWSVIAVPDLPSIPHGAYAFQIIENDPQTPNAEAWHTEDGNGVVLLQAMVGPVLDNGGTVLDGANSVSVSISHEVIETFVDAAVSNWSQGNDGRLIAKEACDPVQDGFYVIAGVAVSDYVKPAYFDPSSQAGPGDLSKLGRLASPFSITPGGYQSVMEPGLDASGQPILVVRSEFGKLVSPWKRAWKLLHGARFSKRARAGADRGAEAMTEAMLIEQGDRGDERGDMEPETPRS